MSVVCVCITRVCVCVCCGCLMGEERVQLCRGCLRRRKERRVARAQRQGLSEFEFHHPPPETRPSPPTCCPPPPAPNLLLHDGRHRPHQPVLPRPRGQYPLHCPRTHTGRNHCGHQRSSPHSTRAFSSLALELTVTSRSDQHPPLSTLIPTPDRSLLQKAYRKSALLHHPDKHASASEAKREQESTVFQQVGFAYAVLKDEARRKRCAAFPPCHLCHSLLNSPSLRGHC